MDRRDERQCLEESPSSLAKLRPNYRSISLYSTDGHPGEQGLAPQHLTTSPPSGCHHCPTLRSRTSSRRRSEWGKPCSPRPGIRPRSSLLRFRQIRGCSPPSRHELGLRNEISHFPMASMSSYQYIEKACEICLDPLVTSKVGDKESDPLLPSSAH